MLEHDKKFDEVFNELQKYEEVEFKQKIFFEGQIYDAYSLIIDIIKTAKNKILIIDNYVDESILKMLAKKNKNVEVVILTSQNNNLTKLDINKFNKQYPTLKVAQSNKFHDRFIIIDNKELYHCGASLKDLGKKCFAISKIIDEEYIGKMNDRVEYCNTNLRSQIVTSSFKIKKSLRKRYYLSYAIQKQELKISLRKNKKYYQKIPENFFKKVLHNKKSNVIIK